VLAPGRAGLTLLHTYVPGRDWLDRVSVRSLGKGQAGLLRPGADPLVLEATLSPHRVATERFVKLTRSLRDFRTRTQMVFQKFPNVPLLHAWMLDGYGTWTWDTGDVISWVPYIQPEWRPYANGDWAQDSGRFGHAVLRYEHQRTSASRVEQRRQFQQ
jgi:hypothetical protein